MQAHLCGRKSNEAMLNAFWDSWRMALAGSHTTLGLMVAIASLYRNLAALSYAIKQQSELSSTQLQKRLASSDYIITPQKSFRLRCCNQLTRLQLLFCNRYLSDSTVKIQELDL
ncbi:MAG TPA: hypothetical protein DIW64_02430 [Cellvibrio sp.]|nr:hypothetical protein [Cellvibrio sp.]